MQIVIAIGMILFPVVFVGMLIAVTRIVYARPPAPPQDDEACPSCGGRCLNECNPGESDRAPRVGRWTVPREEQ